MRDDPKAIFVGGVFRSGTTLMRLLLGKHRDICAFRETKLVEDEIFLSFPQKMHDCPRRLRPDLLKIFKQACMTLLYIRLMFPRSRRIDALWLRYESLWRERFLWAGQFRGMNPAWGLLEALWQPRFLEQIIPSYMPGPKDGKPMTGWAGLRRIISKENIRRNLSWLDPMIDSVTLKDMNKAYGDFWSRIFTEKARKKGKRYWAEKTPANARHVVFLQHCFRGFKFINMRRDIRDSACSAFQRWGGDMKMCLDECANQFAVHLKEQKKVPEDCYLNVRYEKLVQEPEAVLREVTTFLGVDFDPGMLSHGIHADSVGRHRKEFSAELRKYAADRYGALLKETGYEV